MLEILISVSVLFNLLLIYYSVSAARRLYLVATNIQALYDVLSSYRSHVESLHESEMFYGDQTLQALMEHSTQVLDEMDSYEDLMVMVVEDEIDLEEPQNAEKY